MTNRQLFNLFLIIAVYFFSGMVYAKTIKVAVVDSGYDFKSTWTSAKKINLSIPKLCHTGHYDFTDGSELPLDSHGHGTHIASLIAKGNESINYCLIILKYFDPTDARPTSILFNRALKRAIELKVDIINVSGGGTGYLKEECDLIKKALDNGIIVNAAAGNNGESLNKKPYYPAMCDNRVNKIMNIDSNNTLHNTSNYGTNISNLYKEVGVKVLGLDREDSYAILTGTSQSTATFTNKTIKKVNNNDTRSIRND